jgi:hypothetical protein
MVGQTTTIGFILESDPKIRVKPAEKWDFKEINHSNFNNVLDAQLAIETAKQFLCSQYLMDNFTHAERARWKDNKLKEVTEKHSSAHGIEFWKYYRDNNSLNYVKLCHAISRLEQCEYIGPHKEELDIKMKPIKDLSILESVRLSYIEDKNKGRTAFIQMMKLAIYDVLKIFER